MTNRTIEQLIQREEDIHEIENLTSKYFHYHSLGLDNEALEFFALKSVGTRVEMVGGMYEGIVGLEVYYSVKPGENPIEFHTANHMIMLPQTTPYVEVAGDGQTARGMWLLPGLGTNADATMVGNRLQAFWSWARYGVDFIKEGGVWKIWHLHVYGVFRPRYERSWTDHYMHGNLGSPTGEVLPEGVHPVTYGWEWGPDVKTENVPALPEPYETWDDAMSYIPG